MSRPATAAKPMTITGARYTARSNGQPMRTAVNVTIAMTATSAAGSLRARTQSGYGGQGTLRLVDGAGNYESGDDYVVQFLALPVGLQRGGLRQRGGAGPPQP